MLASRSNLAAQFTGFLATLTKEPVKGDSDLLPVEKKNDIFFDSEANTKTASALCLGQPASDGTYEQGN